ncbi:Protein kinase domain [Macleaya cordata]|uniref:Receptor-like serine/threonine-protein kinase n=1 Tax=Macleaya cordata TaxID=56857 RepID=A0A200Q8Y1_MACCD|nr:Protein kinase domain [Macleaya cordata]
MAASIFLFFLLLSVFSTVVVIAQQRNSNITLGSSLSPTTNTTTWLSSSRRFAFGFYQEGNSFAVGIWFAGIPQKTVVWTSNEDNPHVPSNVTLLLTINGLSLRTAQGQDRSISDNTGQVSSASMLDTGNFVLYNSKFEIIWQSFDSPTNTILQGQRLMAGEELFSSISESDHSKGRFRFKMQHDGNLVQYPIQTPDTAPYAYWASGTNGAGHNVTLNLDDDGQLYLVNSTGFNIRTLSKSDGSLPTNRTIFYRMTLDVDGIFRLYSHTLDHNGNWSIVMESSTDKCLPKGLCGVNGYCTLIDQDPDCRCLPGFHFINQGDSTQGCEREDNVENCGSKKGPFKYSMYTLENTEWEDDPYSIVTLNTKEECEGVCLGDCNCEAAMFENQLCKKQKLPLRYGKRTPRDSRTAFIKVGAPPNNNEPTETAKEESKERKKDLVKYILIPGISFVACAFIIIGISGILFYRHRALAYQKVSEQRNIGLIEDMSLQSFTYDALEKATDGFKEVVGRGSFGTVFKGALSNSQRLIAVKRLEKVVDEGEREFQTEMRAIGRTHHRNLVQLLGYCHEGHNRLLVYEYMSNGSLADFLFKAQQCPNWTERVETALNIARGILYLHEECETQIIHCDIKPQNILMDEYGCAKIADFGLAKLLKPDQTKTFTGIRGTRGYVAPEWHCNLPITVKADVYSFGIVLLEIICCRKSLDMELVENEVVLVDWVCQCFDANELGKLVTNEEVDMKKFERMVRVALWCIQDEPSLRPSMKKVVLMLEGTIDIPTPPSPTSFLSSI